MIRQVLLTSIADALMTLFIEMATTVLQSIAPMYFEFR